MPIPKWSYGPISALCSKIARSDTQCIFSSRKAQPPAINAKALQMFESLAKVIRTLFREIEKVLLQLVGEEPILKAQFFGQRVDRISPNSLEVFSFRIKCRHRIGTQLERTPDHFHSGIFSGKLAQGRLRQPTERSKVIRKNLYSDCRHNNSPKISTLQQHPKVYCE